MQPQRIRTHGTALCFCTVLFSLQTQLNRIPEQTASHTHKHTHTKHNMYPLESSIAMENDPFIDDFLITHLFI